MVAGCVASFKKQEIAQATVRLLKHSGTAFTILGDEERCYGNPLVDSGQMDKFASVVRHNVNAIRKTGAEKVVTSCACCYNVLKFRYPEIVDNPGFEVFIPRRSLQNAYRKAGSSPKKISVKN